MTKDINYRMKENWHVEVTAKKDGGISKEPTFKFKFQISAIYKFKEIIKLAERIVKDRLGNHWSVTNVSLEMVGNE